MDNLIKRQDVMELMDWYDHNYGEIESYLDTIREDIKNLPSAEPKFVEVTIDTDDDLLARKIASYKEAIYVNRQTMIVYVPLLSVALITDLGGTIKRKRERDD